MNQAPLFYGAIAPVDREKHRNKKIVGWNSNFGFARSSHFIPLVVDEFGPACREFPIVFLPGQAQMTAVCLVGLKPGTNLYVSDDGQWNGKYIPAYLRRYPFILGEVENADPIICVDEASEMLSDEAGEPLFDDEGKETEKLRRQIGLVDQYSVAAKRTEALASLLGEMDIMRPISVEATGGVGGSYVIHGLFAVDEQKLSALSDEQFLKLRSMGVLGPIYAHLLSLAALDQLHAKATTPAA